MRVAKKTGNPASAAVIARPTAEERADDSSPAIVGIGASAGGLEAFTELLSHLPDDTGMAFVLIQHLDPSHESHLTELLSKASRMPVSELKDETRAEPNHVYVMPPRSNLGIADGVLLTPARPASGRNMPIDAFLRSLAADRGGRAIGVVLSGTASDGTLGLQAIKAAGGATFAQEVRTAKFDSMPRSAIAAGVVDFVLPPAGIARRPCVPSDADPDRTTPAAWLPRSAARARKKESIGRLRPLCGRGGVCRTALEMLKLHRDGIT